MPKATLLLDKDYVISDVDPRLFGGFVEHLGRCVYEGIYEPDHPTTDEDGFRKDVLELTRELNMPVMRYPGGNFVSGYNWEDGIGPRAARPVRLDLAWKTMEPNHIGVNEFVDWCKKANTAPMMAVNLGTRGPDEARDMVEYCNFIGGSYWSDQRKKHGYDAPHSIKLWCLGNEMDGPWQMGHKTAEEYGRAALETAKLMKWVDSDIELVVCGSSARAMPSFGAWEETVLGHCFDHVEYVSLHTYYDNHADNTPYFLAKSDEMGDFIKETIATCDFVSAKRKSAKRLMLSFDEWNVWFHSHKALQEATPWQYAPPILEDVYTMEDALLVGGMLITLLNHADRVKIGCLAQLVNVIAPIMTQKGGAAWKQTTFYPFAHASNRGRGTVLRQVVNSEVYDVKERQAVPYLTSAAVLHPEDDSLTVFAVNRSLDESLELSLDLRAFDSLKLTEWITMSHDDLKAVNTVDAPDTVTPTTLPTDGCVTDSGKLSLTVPPASWNVLEFKPVG